ncbi:MAG: GTP-binding protein [Clostridiales bacterium]|jgi:G3E family GTPase|nr:GTP-binding protein [Clostridiales bacterium]
MATGIYIVSGFLGAGKTTLIQKLLRELFSDEKIVLIENDFGEISVDAALLRTGSIEVTEMNSGCICCSLTGDFVKAMKELLERFHPGKIIIEPSGVGKLSDVINACSDPLIKPLASIKKSIAVVDVKRIKMYLDNFGEFFEDQIEMADIIALSRVEIYPEKISGARMLLRGLNPHAPIISRPWGEISASGMLFPEQTRSHDSEHSHEHVHDHSAEEVFDTVTIHVKRTLSLDDMKSGLAKLEQASGEVLRAKGILPSPSGFMNLQYIPGDASITKCSAGGDMLCIIGRNLNRRELCALFGGE